MRDQLLRDLPVNGLRLDVAGVATSVLEGGEGPLVVLLHGGTQAGGVAWFRVIRRLAESHRVVVPDLPGLGESKPLMRLDSATVASWIEELLRVTGRCQPTLVAHSAPGGLAARFAARHGDLLRRLVLVDAAGLGPFRPSPGFLVALLRSNVRPSRRSFERFMRWVMHDLDRIREEDGERLEAFEAYVLSRATLPSVKQAMRQVVKAGTKRLPDAELRRITVPTVLLWGRHDRLVPLRIAEATSARLGWPLHVMDDAGHLPHVERPDAFVDALDAAIAEETS